MTLKRKRKASINSGAASLPHDKIEREKYKEGKNQKRKNNAVWF